MTTKTGKKSAWKKDDLLTAYLVLLPSFLLLVTFVIAPLVISVVNSFYDSSAYMDAMWKGMGNYTKVLTDEKFWKSIGVGLKKQGNLGRRIGKRNGLRLRYRPRGARARRLGIAG